MVQIEKLKMSLTEKAMLENAIAKTEANAAMLEYIAICDHPEILDEETEVEE